MWWGRPVQAQGAAPAGPARWVSAGSKVPSAAPPRETKGQRLPRVPAPRPPRAAVAAGPRAYLGRPNAPRRGLRVRSAAACSGARSAGRSSRGGGSSTRSGRLSLRLSVSHRGGEGGRRQAAGGGTGGGGGIGIRARDGGAAPATPQKEVLLRGGARRGGAPRAGEEQALVNTPLGRAACWRAEP